MHLHIDGLHNYRGHSVCMCSHGICPAYHAYECLQLLHNSSKDEQPASTISNNPTSRIEEAQTARHKRKLGQCSKNGRTPEHH